MERVTCPIVSHGCALFDLPQSFLVSVVEGSLLYLKEEHHLRFVHFLSFAVTVSVPEAFLLSYNFIHPFPLISLCAALKLKKPTDHSYICPTKVCSSRNQPSLPFYIHSSPFQLSKCLQMNTNSLLCMWMTH